MDHNSGNNNRPTDRYENYYVSHNTEAKENQEDHLPEGNLFIRRLNDTLTSLYGLCLFDSGSTSTLINRHAIPPNVAPKQGATQLVTTTQGNFSSSDYFDAQEIVFPAFCSTRKIPKVHLRTFSSTTSRYDFIVGRDVLKMGFILDHAHNCVTWDGLSIAMTKLASTELPTAAVTHFSCSHMFEATYAADVKKLIREAKYESISPSQVASKCIHLVPKQQI